MNNDDEREISPISTNSVEQGVQNGTENDGIYCRRGTVSTTDQHSETALLSAASSTTTVDFQDNPKVKYKSVEEVLLKLGIDIFYFTTNDDIQVNGTLDCCSFLFQWRLFGESQRFLS